MNFALRHKDGLWYYLIGVYMTSDGGYAVSCVSIFPSGVLRAKGECTAYKTKDAALRRVKVIKRIKTKKNIGFKECSLLDIPKAGRLYMKPDVDTYIPADEMLKMMEDALREYYVEFDCVTGIEERFDEGIEYLALRDPDDDDFFDVYDRYGQICKCGKSRFSRCEPTERAEEVLKLGGGKKGYVCPNCKDSENGCASCTS